ncbi:MAG: hypothetical protein HYW71_00775 [Candidatus Niyogibacteria bacterium]|nr:hypothetical protein [Candidatus Niyogibacteria bacterium]
MEALEIFSGGFAVQILKTFQGLWYIWLPAALFFISWEIWIIYIQIYFVTNISWMLLEVKVPHNVFKSPRAMELVFNALHNTYEGNRLEKYWKGFVKGWLSFEIASLGGKISFFVRVPKFMKNLVEAQIYAQYPEVEIAEIDDYTRLLPENIPNEDWNLWGVEFGLTKEDAFPIRTYMDFKLEDVKEEMEKIDPMSSLLEFMSSIREGENVWFQVLIRASGNKWLEEGEKLKKKISEKTKSKEGAPPQPLLPGDTETLKALDRNMAKLGFDAGIRVIYAARRDIFNPINISSITGVMKQYNSQNLNGFKPQKKTSGGFWFKKKREYRKQRSMVRAFRRRDYFYHPFRRKSFVLSSEELATIYHYPGRVVSAPTFERGERKKGTPPPNLPI